MTSGCLDHPVKTVTTRRDTPVSDFLRLKNNRDVDVLFVVDNSGSMGEEQRALSRNFASFVQVLDAPDLRANYRLGVTTSDMGASHTPGCSSPEKGALQLQSCKDRPQAFVDPSGDIHRFNTACKSVCNLDPDQLEIVPSAIDGSDNLAPRAWLERINGQSNLQDPDTSIADAFGCFGPQGISGCGYESQLESMYQALKKSELDSADVNHPNYGFLRDDAILAVIHVSDELDCSLNPSHPLQRENPAALHEEVLGRDSKAFWGKHQQRSSSANCFHAGVNCSGVDGDNYEACVAANKSTKGTTLSPDEDQNQAVLAPLERYVKGVQAIADAKSSDGKGEVIVSIIGGVNKDGSIDYPRADSGSAQDLERLKDFGIGAGCSNETSFLEEKDATDGHLIPAGTETGFALPPVRLAQFASAFAAPDEQFAYQICQENLTGPLKRIAKSIAAKLEPSCYYGCVVDAKPELDLMVPACTVAMVDPVAGGFEVVRECARQDPDNPGSAYLVDDADGRYQIPEGQELCFVARTDFDGQQSDDPNDDLAAKCRSQGRNVEFFIEYKPGYRPPNNKALKVSCELSENAALECSHL